jgi:putative aldouronate transport system substrate-binding protein
MNKLYKDGLIDKELFIKKSEQLQKDFATRVFVVPGRYWDTSAATQSLTKQFGEEKTYFYAMDPMKAVPKVEYPGENRMGWTITLITKKAKNPEALIKFIRYMWNRDGNLLMNYGKEGVDYKLVDEKSVLRISPDGNLNEYRIKKGILQLSFFKYDWLKEALPDTPAMKQQMEMRALIDKSAKDWTAITYKMEPDPTTAEGTVATRIKEIAKTAMPRIILADSEEKAVSLYQEMLANMEKSGLKQLEDYYSKQYKKNVEKFGAEYALK